MIYAWSAILLSFVFNDIVHQFACIPGIAQLSKTITNDDVNVAKKPTFYRAIAPTLAWITVILIVTMQIGFFWYFKAPTYGDVSLTPEEWTARKWLSGWNFHFASWVNVNKMDWLISTRFNLNSNQMMHGNDYYMWCTCWKSIECHYSTNNRSNYGIALYGYSDCYFSIIR
jgi:hypothetical protein